MNWTIYLNLLIEKYEVLLIMFLIRGDLFLRIRGYIFSKNNLHCYASLFSIYQTFSCLIGITVRDIRFFFFRIFCARVSAQQLLLLIMYFVHFWFHFSPFKGQLLWIVSHIQSKLRLARL